MNKGQARKRAHGMLGARVLADLDSGGFTDECEEWGDDDVQRIEDALRDLALAHLNRAGL